MKKTFLAAFMHMTTLLVFAQGDFREGYIISNGGDTTTCFINYRIINKEHRTCEVKYALNEDVVQLNANDIEGYGVVDDRFFESRIVHTEEKETEPVFVEIIVHGQISLYRYENQFFIRQDTTMIPLLTVKKEIVVNGQKMIREDKKYVGVLTMAFGDCRMLNSEISKSKLNQKSLTQLIESYNECTGAPYVTYSASKPWFKADCGLGVSANITKIHFSSYMSDFSFLTGDFPASYSLSPLIFLNAYSPRINEQLSFHLGFYFLQSEFKTTIVELESSGTIRNDVFIEQQELKMPIGIKYQFVENKVTPYLNTGISVNIPLGSSSGRVLEIEDNFTVRTSEKTPLPIPESTFGIWGGIGVDIAIHQKTNLFVEARYEWARGHIDEFPYLSNSLISNANSVRLLIGWRF